MTDEEYIEHMMELGEDVLAHYGVKGMKWGQRKQANSYDIKQARARLQVKRGEYQQAKKHARKTHKSNRAEAKAEVARLKTDFLKDPDRVTASRMTRGEKAISLLLPGAQLAGLASIAVSSSVSRRIEYKQENGGYDK